MRSLSGRFHHVVGEARSNVGRLLRIVQGVLITCTVLFVLALSYKNHSLRKEFIEHRRADMRAERGGFIPTFTTRATDGEMITVAHAEDSSARQIVFVLTSTCPYCRRTLASWGRITNRIHATHVRPLSVIALTTDSLMEAQRFARAQRFAFPIVPFPERKLVSLSRASVVPQTLVLNAEGRVIYTRRGVIDTRVAEDSVVSAALRVLPAKKQPPKLIKTAAIQHSAVALLR
jgi:peroxiredoxin